MSSSSSLFLFPSVYRSLIYTILSSPHRHPSSRLSPHHAYLPNQAFPPSSGLKGLSPGSYPLFQPLHSNLNLKSTTKPVATFLSGSCSSSSIAHLPFWPPHHLITSAAPPTRPAVRTELREACFSTFQNPSLHVPEGPAAWDDLPAACCAQDRWNVGPVLYLAGAVRGRTQTRGAALFCHGRAKNLRGTCSCVI